MQFFLHTDDADNFMLEFSDDKEHVNVKVVMTRPVTEAMVRTLLEVFSSDNMDCGDALNCLGSDFGAVVNYADKLN